MELQFAPIATALTTFTKGGMLIVTDDEDRENEGDLIIGAQFADAGAINFMAKHGRGLICLAMTAEQLRQIDVPMMPRRSGSSYETAFAVSIEAATGVTTGISASDRARTVAVAIAQDARPCQISFPGHVFPLRANDGGVLVRRGHTEAAVDLAMLSGLHPAGVICEIMNEDGSMAKGSELAHFAQTFGLLTISIDALAKHIIELGPDHVRPPKKATHSPLWDVMI